MMTAINGVRFAGTGHGGGRGESIQAECWRILIGDDAHNPMNGCGNRRTRPVRPNSTKLYGRDRLAARIEPYRF